MYLEEFLKFAATASIVWVIYQVILSRRNKL